MSPSEKMIHNLTTDKSASANLHVCFGGFSSAGIKNENQDAFAAIAPPAPLMVVKGAIAAIADGVSSASMAAQAAQLSVTQFIDEYYATPEMWSTKKSAAKVLTSLNQWLFSQSSSLYNQSPQWLTTFSAIILKSATGYIFHVGDTRISRYRQRQLETITKDHNCKQGVDHMVLTRALGADSRLKVDMHQIELNSGDVYVLTSDGVHEYLSNKIINEHLALLSPSPSSHDLELTSQTLVNLAIKAGSDDNTSCLLCSVGQIPNRKIEEIERDLFNKIIPPALQVGQKIDGFKVIKNIHASIRSHLYLVQDDQNQQLAILKAPSTNFSHDAIYLQGFIREAWVGERIKHPNIMAIKKAQDNRRFLYHICEYINGQTLTQWMQDNPKPQISVVRDIIQQIINALRAFQRMDLVHRDLKPDNIMIDSNGQIKLIDYGTVFVASIDENQETLAEIVPQGTLNYIAPETLLTMKADHQSDLFSLGVICYEMLSGELPFKPWQRAEVNFKHYSQWQYRSIKQFRADIPLWLDLCLQQATLAEPKYRYPAFSEFFADLNKPNLGAVEEYKKQPLLQRNPIMFWQGLSLILFICLALSLFY